MTRAKPTKPDTQSLPSSGMACDQVAELSAAFKAYIGLERLVSPVTKDGAPARAPTARSEQGARLRSLNAEMLRQIGDLEKTAVELQAADERRRGAAGHSGGPDAPTPPPA